MDVPGIVEEALDGEEVAASVDLGGDDALFVTPTRTLIYRSEGLLSDESVESYSHEAESLSLSHGRRKTRITLDHPIDGVEEFTLPSGAADEAIPSILAGILGMNDVLEDGESVVDSYLFSELTLVIADNRLVKHVGETVWDLDFEEYPFADVTGVYAEKGSVATQLVIEIDGRAERIKTPSDRSREVREELEGAIRRYHGLAADADLNDALAPAEPGDTASDDVSEESDDGSGGGMDFGEGVDPLSAGDTTQDGRNPDPADLDGPRTNTNDTTDRTGTDAVPTEDSVGAADAGASSQQSSAGGAAPQSRSSNDAAAASDEVTQESGATDQAQPSATNESNDGRANRTGSGSDPSTQQRSDDPDRTSPAADPPDGPAAGDAKAVDTEAASDRTDELAEEVEELRVAVQKQNKLLTRQHKTIQKLVEELRRGR